MLNDNIKEITDLIKNTEQFSTKEENSNLIKTFELDDSHERIHRLINRNVNVKSSKKINKESIKILNNESFIFSSSLKSEKFQYNSFDLTSIKQVNNVSSFDILDKSQQTECQYELRFSKDDCDDSQLNNTMNIIDDNYAVNNRIPISELKKIVYEGQIVRGNKGGTKEKLNTENSVVEEREKSKESVKSNKCVIY
jgi:hypothetical protein